MIDKKSATTIGKELEAAIKKVCEKHDIKLVKASGKFNDHGMKVNFVLETSDAPKRDDIILEDLRRFHPELEGFNIELRNKTYTVVGYDKKKRFNRMIVEDAQGKKFKWDFDNVFDQYRKSKGKKK